VTFFRGIVARSRTKATDVFEPIRSAVIARINLEDVKLATDEPMM